MTFLANPDKVCFSEYHFPDIGTELTTTDASMILSAENTHAEKTNTPSVMTMIFFTEKKKMFFTKVYEVERSCF